MKNNLAIFEGYKIRRHYDEKTETWYFSVVDIILSQKAQGQGKSEGEGKQNRADTQVCPYGGICP